MKTDRNVKYSEWYTICIVVMLNAAIFFGCTEAAVEKKVCDINTSEDCQPETESGFQPETQSAYPFPTHFPPATWEGMDAKTEWMVFYDLFNRPWVDKADELGIKYSQSDLNPDWEIGKLFEKRFYGNYNGCIIIFIPGDNTAVTWITVGGIRFGHMNTFTMPAWVFDETTGRGRIFRRIQDAYDLGYLTDENVSSMYEIHKTWE